MLKGIDPLLTPDLLHTLAAMGHGDELVLVDANFPATSLAAETVVGTPIPLAGVDVVAAAQAVLTLLPLDDFVAHAAFVMQVVDDPDTVPPVVTLLEEVVNAAHGSQVVLCPLERHAFYARARHAFAIVATGEQRLYGNIILKKGVVRPA